MAEKKTGCANIETMGETLAGLDKQASELQDSIASTAESFSGVVETRAKLLELEEHKVVGIENVERTLGQKARCPCGNSA